jgi:hypothetical protein
MPQTYPLQWLDSLISITLNPKKNRVRSITADELSIISEKILEETLYIQTRLNNQIFVFRKECEIRLLVQKYHSALIVLLDSVIDNQNNEVFNNPELSEVMDTLVSCLDELLSFIETRFSNYLGFDERVPSTYLIVTKKELKIRLDNLKEKLIKDVDDKSITDIVLGSLYAFVNSKSNYPVTYREVLYQKELIRELEILKKPQREASIFTALDELLIYMNFNSKEYINYFRDSIAKRKHLFQNDVDKLDRLLFLFKEFSQMHSNENIGYNLNDQNLKTVLSNWFIQEIAYLEKKIHQSVVSKQDSEKTSNQHQVKNKEHKITCLLSADQIGLILRASDESRILNAKSMSEVFKMIVPHLSTPYKSDLSYHSVRSKSYNAEDKDKEIAIETLEKIIKKIKSY